MLWITLRPATPGEEIAILTSTVNGFVAGGLYSAATGQALIDAAGAAITGLSA